MNLSSETLVYGITNRIKSVPINSCYGSIHSDTEEWFPANINLGSDSFNVVVLTTQALTSMMGYHDNEIERWI
jgi:hypothetical protein